MAWYLVKYRDKFTFSFVLQFSSQVKGKVVPVLN